MENIFVEVGRTVGSLLLGGAIVAWLAKRFVQNIEDDIRENAQSITSMRSMAKGYVSDMSDKITKLHERVDNLQTQLPNDYVRRPEYDQMNARFDRIEAKLDRLLERE